MPCLIRYSWRFSDQAVSFQDLHLLHVTLAPHSILLMIIFDPKYPLQPLGMQDNVCPGCKHYKAGNSVLALHMCLEQGHLLWFLFYSCACTKSAWRCLPNRVLARRSPDSTCALHICMCKRAALHIGVCKRATQTGQSHAVCLYFEWLCLSASLLGASTEWQRQQARQLNVCSLWAQRLQHPCLLCSTLVARVKLLQHVCARSSHRNRALLASQQRNCLAPPDNGWQVCTRTSACRW